MSGSIAGEIADRSLENYMPQLSGYSLRDTKISGGQISTTVTDGSGKTAAMEMYSASQFEKPEGPHSMVTASDGSQWYQMASGEGARMFYDAPVFTGSPLETDQVAAAFPDAEAGMMLRTVGDGIMEASTDEGSALWYNSAYYEEPDAPHTTIQSADGVDWYAMRQNAAVPDFGEGDAAFVSNQAKFQAFMPGYEPQVSLVDGSGQTEGHFEVHNQDGSGTMFYDVARYAPPKGDYQVFEDTHGGQWYAIRGKAAVERRPVYEDGEPVYDGKNVRSVSVETVRYQQPPSRYGKPKVRSADRIKPPRRKH